MSDYSNLPDFDSLPPVEGMPQGCAWGLFDKNGKKDHLGCLNLLTPQVVQNAFKEATDGEPHAPESTKRYVLTPSQAHPSLSTGPSAPSKPPASVAKASSTMSSPSWTHPPLSTVSTTR